MENVELMNVQIIRRQAFYMERNKEDSIGMDPEMQIIDEDEAGKGYVIYADDAYNFKHQEDRADMFSRMMQGICQERGWKAESLDAFIEEAVQAAAQFKKKLVKRG